MANPVRYHLSGASGHGPRTAASVALVAMALGGCSINLGSLTPSSETEEPVRFTSSINNLASLSEAIKNSPNDPIAYNKRGSALAQAGKTDEALADFDKAIGLDPNYGPAYANRGLIYRQTRRLDLAMADFERAISLDANTRPLISAAA
jgi:regulator of sirC expression with transglutaminase-like and TPR domain